MLFGSKTRSYLGVDIGKSSIKVVELANEKGNPLLVTYGFSEQTIDLVKSDSKEDEEKMVYLLTEICKKAQVTTTKAITALPTFAVISSIMSLPSMPKKDLAMAIRWQAKKIIPLPIEEMVLDWKILSTTEIKKGAKEKETPLSSPFIKGEEKEGKEEMKILLTGAAKNLVAKYVEIFKKANLDLLGLETEAFALIRTLIGGDKSVIMLVNIGAATTDISVIDEGIPFLNRSIDVGGLTITRAVSNSLNVNLSHAEQFKYDIGVVLGEGKKGEIPQTIENAISPIVNELKYCINLYQGQSGKTVEKVILGGGSALLLNLVSYLSQILNIKVYIGDPWARIIYPEDLKPVLTKIAPRFAVAVGLAMRDII
ncbi:MAG: hypothetical protein COY82_01535 [Parcubacteria group bacterium CG_4_10_14_0_8_um_filter_35_7]|nr:MAG: hypothetical protein COY82_01535 [Parcubacteria group bacterium CG_4_10_14_0_8_um_filter_35_7]